MDWIFDVRDLDNIGTIEKVIIPSLHIIQIKKQEWAPGIWAGTEGAKIMINNQVFTIFKIDLEERMLHLYSSHNSSIKPDEIIQRFA